MHDKYVRRRRLVLAALVAVSLILLTAYFGEAENSPLHSIQQGIVSVFTPVQEGASKVLSPIRDLAGWVSSTVHAKSQNKELTAEVSNLRTQVAQDGWALEAYDHLSSLDKLDSRLGLSQYGPVNANVYTYNPEVFYESVSIDRGTDSGIAVGDPVISSQGLVGDISSVGSDWAAVATLFSPKYGVEAMIENGGSNNSCGTLQPATGNPTSLQINYLPSTAQVSTGDMVVTCGYSDPSNSVIKSLYPPGIPIGNVPSFNDNELVDDGQVNVSPYVNLRNITQVQVLTKVNK